MSEVNGMMSRIRGDGWVWGSIIPYIGPYEDERGGFRQSSPVKGWGFRFFSSKEGSFF